MYNQSHSVADLGQFTFFKECQYGALLGAALGLTHFAVNVPKLGHSPETSYKQNPIQLQLV